MKCLICKNTIILRLDFWSLNKLCSDCYVQLKNINGKCIICKGNYKVSNDVCLNCKELGNNIKVISLFSYNQFAKSIVRRIKISHEYNLLEIFKYQLYFILKIRYAFWKKIFVPSKNTNYIRFPVDVNTIVFNYLNIKINSDIIRIDNSKKQSRLSIDKRMKNKIIYITKKNIKSRRIVIFDDIYTTGKTAFELKKLIDKNCNKKIVYVTIFR